MKTQPQYSPELRERAVRMVLDQRNEHESQWAAIASVASKIGCTSETLRRWVRQTERDTGVREGLSSESSRRGFLFYLGILLSGLFLLAIILGTIPMLVLDPCLF